MKTRVYIIALLSVLTLPVSAQTYGTTYSPSAQAYSVIPHQQTIQSQQLIATGNAYKGTVYEPFSTAMPSDYSEVGSANSSDSGKPGRQIRTFIKPGETGQSDEFPIGEPWVLLLCAAAYGVWRTADRRRQRPNNVIS